MYSQAGVCLKTSAVVVTVDATAVVTVAVVADVATTSHSVVSWKCPGFHDLIGVLPVCALTVFKKNSVNTWAANSVTLHMGLMSCFIFFLRSKLSSYFS